jgi:hypothetical protein
MQVQGLRSAFLPPKLLVFYADRLYAEMTTKEIKALCTEAPEIYNGAFVWSPSVSMWFRCDFTPCLEEDVPPATRLLKLLMT